jgi:hypothetical protein
VRRFWPFSDINFLLHLSTFFSFRSLILFILIPRRRKKTGNLEDMVMERDGGRQWRITY